MSEAYSNILMSFAYFLLVWLEILILKLFAERSVAIWRDRYSSNSETYSGRKQNLTNFICFQVIYGFLHRFIIIIHHYSWICYLFYSSVYIFIYKYPVFTSMKVRLINYFKCIFLTYYSRYSQRHRIWNHFRTQQST